MDLTAEPKAAGPEPKAAGNDAPASKSTVFWLNIRPDAGQFDNTNKGKQALDMCIGKISGTTAR